MVSSCVSLSTQTWKTGSCRTPPPPSSGASWVALPDTSKSPGTAYAAILPALTARRKRRRPPTRCQPPINRSNPRRRRVLPRVSRRFAAVLRGPSDAWESTTVDMRGTVPRARYPYSPPPPQVPAWSDAVRLAAKCVLRMCSIQHEVSMRRSGHYCSTEYAVDRMFTQSCHLLADEEQTWH